MKMSESNELQNLVDGDEVAGSPVKTLAKGLAVLDLLMAGDVVRTNEAASHLKIDKATASRLLHTLAQTGYAVRLGGRGYILGPKLKHAGNGQPRTLVERVRPLLERLVELTGEAAHLAIVAGDQIRFEDRIDSPNSLRVDRPIGSLAPLHCTALGKALLAFGAAALPDHMMAYTPRTVVEPELVRMHMRQNAARGYATGDEEFTIGVRCAAAPIHDANGKVVGAISVGGPTQRVDLPRLDELGRLIREIAASCPTA